MRISVWKLCFSILVSVELYYFVGCTYWSTCVYCDSDVVGYTILSFPVQIIAMIYSDVDVFEKKKKIHEKKTSIKFLYMSIKPCHNTQRHFDNDVCRNSGCSLFYHLVSQIRTSSSSVPCRDILEYARGLSPVCPRSYEWARNDDVSQTKPWQECFIAERFSAILLSRKPARAYRMILQKNPFFRPCRNHNCS